MDWTGFVLERIGSRTNRLGVADPDVKAESGVTAYAPMSLQ